ncbi:hypothetical protein APX70_04216 [Pseudomonas syringae pv. maculicola]|uniref:Uncharacterized protein n=1 Tax=Pseudomonas syringae pv. maculicola TaxID=59511 RepID=A0A3M2XCU5_PSEYM|nr:hypothetical protein APX70_04216 [Pseudomonas syringae pv. maculicola]
MQSAFKMRGNLCHLLHQILTLQQLQRCKPGSTRHRMRRIGITVGEFNGVIRRRLIHEGLVNLAAGNHRAHGYRAVGDLFGDAHQVRCHAETVSTKHRAGAPETGDDFIEDQQNIMLIANLTQPLEVALRRNDHAGRTCHRLYDDCRNVRRIVQFDQFQHFVGQRDTACFRHALGVRIAGQQGMRQVIDIHQLPEHLAVAVYPTQAGTTDIHAMIAARPTDHLGLGRLPFQPPVGTHHLHCGICTLRARVGIEHVIEIARRQFGNLFCQLKRQRMPELKARRVIQHAQLAGNGFLNFLARMPSAAGPQTGKPIVDLAALVVCQIAAMRGDDHARIAVEVAVRGVRHPVSIQLQLTCDRHIRQFEHIHGSEPRRRLS